MHRRSVHGPASLHFYPRPPRGGRHPAEHYILRVAYISIHALREEGDPADRPATEKRCNFYPRPPRGGRRKRHGTVQRKPNISIHALREEGDEQMHITLEVFTYFYPRPPRGGRRDGVAPEKPRDLFLSTPSARRATRHWASIPVMPVNFYPRPPRGGRPSRCCCGDVGPYFYPRPPRGGRRSRRHWRGCRNPISIHALREEGDDVSSVLWYSCTDFYPRPPRGGRPWLPLAECPPPCYFYPRPPRGGRL